MQRSNLKREFGESAVQNADWGIVKDEGGEEGRGQIRKGLVMTWSWEPCR